MFFYLAAVIFLVTAGIAVWSSYDPKDAWIKFWLLFTSVFFYFLFAQFSTHNLWKAGGTLSLLGFGLGIYFIITNNWGLHTQGYGPINQIISQWIKIQQNFLPYSIHPSDVAGLAAFTLPFSIAIMIESRKKQKQILYPLFTLITSILLIVIILSGSLGVWISIVLTIGLLGIWGIVRVIGNFSRTSWRLYSLFVLFLLLFIGLGWAEKNLKNQWLQISINSTAPTEVGQRFHLFWSAVELIKDLPITGGGLDSFPGLYSTYIMRDPHYLTGYGHNILLDSTVEQGIVGGLMLIIIYIGLIVWITRESTPPTKSPLKLAILASLFIIVFLGLVDNIFYDKLFTPFLFIIPGIAFGFINTQRMYSPKLTEHKTGGRTLLIGIAFMIVVLTSGFIALRKPLLSAWYTDIGSVLMEKVELVDFPTGTWDDGGNADLFSQAESSFRIALSYSPGNPQANYRLGLIALSKKDFPPAMNYLQTAYTGDSNHRGIIKSLGLSYVWNGQVDKALPLLSLIPESKQELEIYQWWWSQQNRTDLALYAAEYIEKSGSGQSP